LAQTLAAEQVQHSASATKRPEDQMLPHNFLTVGSRSSSKAQGNLAA
jgi:hypothetical protein